MKISKQSAEHYLWGAECDGWHLVKGSELSVIHERMPAGTSEVAHYHERARQFFFLLEGTADMELNGETYSLAVGEGIEVAPGTTHRIVNRSASDAEFLVISQPPSHGDRVVV